MNYTEALEQLTSQEKFHINLGLERVKKVAASISNPQDKIKTIHVAGTNGKGSTCAMLAKIFEENGYKTGLYTSPHIKEYTERIKINFNDISKEDFAKYFEMIEKKANDESIKLTEFEILTLMAFLYFKEEKVDIAIIETGMGGRLDATNIIEKPLLTIITSISNDHTDRLGDTIAKISYEKAGIIKKDTCVIVSQNNAGYRIIEEKAKTVNAPILSVQNDFELINKEKNIFSNGKKSLELSLWGINQGENLALVNETAKILNLNIDSALKKVIWQGRFEYLKEKNIIFDAAHNSDGVRLLKENLSVYFKNKKRAFLFGMLNTKDYKSAVLNLFEEKDEVFVTDNFAHNSIKKEILAEEIKKMFPKIKLKLVDIDKAKDFTDYNFNGIKICCGSFYLLSKIY